MDEPAHDDDQIKAPTPAADRPARQKARRWARRALVISVLLMMLTTAAHFAVGWATAMTPPGVSVPSAVAVVAADDPGRRQLGDNYARMRGAIHEVRLVGDPAAIGQAHVALLKEQRVAIEAQMRAELAHYVPLAPARWLLLDMARLRFRKLDRALSERHRVEIAAQALAFAPDPFSDMMPTYQRFVFLESLYDIMLSFEHSPLIGCSSVVVRSGAAPGQHTLLARNFDFEGPSILDSDKAVFLVREQGRIPYASVSWPGFIGSATGMNAAGLGMVIHGARAGQTRPDGEPVAQTVRDLLGLAHDTTEALALLNRRDPMVPHILFMVDAAGEAVAVERVPGQPAYLRRATGPTMALTNHFEGPSASDPQNQRVRAVTSTVARRERLDEILANVHAPINVQQAVEILRDKRATGGGELPLGDRRAVDALIATHSVVMDCSARALWVGEGPHAAGRYQRFDLVRLLDADYRPAGPARVETLPADDIVSNGRYHGWVRAGSPHPMK